MKTQRLISPRHLMPWLIFILVLALVPAGAQKVPATAREAATLPQFAPRLAHNRTPPHRAPAPAHAPSCSPLPKGYGSRATLPQDGVIYDNGPYNGTTDAWTINFGVAISNSFTCSGGCDVGGFHIGVWLFPGDAVGSVDAAFGSSAFGGTFNTYAATGHTDLGLNQYGYDLQIVDFGPFPSVDLPAGTNWITLQNAVETQFGDPVYWDENSGPSQAYENTLGSIPSETFTLTGGGNGCMPEQSGDFSVIHDFTGQDDGVNPSGVTIGMAGELFGPTRSYPGGTVFRLFKAGSDWVFNTLYHFAGGDLGSYPDGVIIGRNGILYGDAYGGIQNCERGEYCGLIFGLRPAPTACLTGSCSWSGNVPYSFTGPTDAWQGHGLVSDKAGNLYGVSYSGGVQQQGAVFELTPSSGGWIESILYSFTGGSDGGGPTTVLVGNDGNLYGMAGNGGANGDGVVFQLTPSGSSWTEAVVSDLPYSLYGSSPHSLIQDSAGSLFGEWDYWYEEPEGSGETLGVVFMLSPSSGGWIYTELRRGNHQIYTNDVFVNLTLDAAGNLYGTGGGAAGCVNPIFHGYIFKLTRGSEGWQYSTPMYWDHTKFDTEGALALDAQGNLYGTTSSCGRHQHGTVWELTPTQ